MSPLPAVTYKELDNSSAPARLLTGQHGVIIPTLFGLSDKPYLVRSVDQFKQLFGGPSSASSPFFAQVRRALKRGVQLYIQRLIGTTSPALASDASLTTTSVSAEVTITAKMYGAFANGSTGISYTYHKSTGGADPYTLAVSYAGDTTLDESFSAATFDALVALVNDTVLGSKWITITLGGSYTVPDTQAATTLAGGADGTFADSAAKDTAINAAFALFNDTINIDTISAPGVYTATTLQNLITYAEGRGDLMGLYEIDPTETDSQAITTATGYTETSSYIAVYYGSESKAWSPEEQKYVSGVNLFDVMGAYSYTDTTAEPFNVPAGATRGLIPDVLSYTYNMLSPARKANADTLAELGVNIVGQDPDFGPVVWGAKTFNKKNTSLDSIGVRRMLIWLKKTIVPLFKQSVFEPMNPKSWRGAYGRIKPVLDALERQDAIYAGWVYTGDQDASKIQDALYNQAADLANNIYKVKINMVAQGYIDQLQVTIETDSITTLFQVNNAA